MALNGLLKEGEREPGEEVKESAGEELWVFSLEVWNELFLRRVVGVALVVLLAGVARLWERLCGGAVNDLVV